MQRQIEFLTGDEAMRFVFVVTENDGVAADRFESSVLVEGATDDQIQQAIDVVGRAGGFEPLEDLESAEPRSTRPVGRVWSPGRAFLVGTGLIVGFLLAYPIAAIPLMLVLLVSVSYRWWRDDT